MEKRLAKVVRTFLGVEDHGIFTCSLTVEYEGGSQQDVGNYSLDSRPHDGKGRLGTAEGMQFVAALIRACGAPSWEKIPGHMIYVLADTDDYNANIIGVQGVAFGGKSPHTMIFADVFAPCEQ